MHTSGAVYDPMDAHAYTCGSSRCIWMQPVAVQDERPSAGVFDEAGNTQNLRDTWSVAINGDAEWVQLVTWNGYDETTQFAPSLKHWAPNG